MPLQREVFKRYTVCFCAVLSAYLILVVSVTTTVDPWRVLRMPWALESLEEYRDFSDAHRTGKAGLALDPEGWDIAFVGSSRVENGLDTSYEAFGKKRVVNLGLAGGLIDENTAMGHFLITKNPGLKTILFGVDTGDLTSLADMSSSSDFYLSPLAAGSSGMERKISYLTSVRALTDSLAVVTNRIKEQKSKYTLTGQRIGKLGDPPPFREFIVSRKGFYQSQARAFDPPAESPFNSKKYEKLAGFLKAARSAGIKVIVFVTPRHALLQIHPQENAPTEAPWQRERLALIRLCEETNALPLGGPEISLLDFCTFSPLNTQALPEPEPSDPPFTAWPDLEHYEHQIGAQILERCFGSDAETIPQWGVDVLAVGAGKYFSDLRTGHEQYCREHPENVAWFREVIFAE